MTLTLEPPPLALDQFADEADYAVIGPTDGRTRVLAARRFPYGAVCQIERDFGDGTLIGCTAFMISPTRLQITAHCIMSPIRKRLAFRIWRRASGSRPVAMGGAARSGRDGPAVGK